MEKKEEQQTKPSFCEWFNPDDIDHLHAYHVLQTTGMWPKGFVPKNIYMDKNWLPYITSKLADKWIGYKLSQIPFTYSK